MKKILSLCSPLGILSAVALALQPGVALAAFSPIALTTNSYDFNIVVSSNYLPTVNEYIWWVGSGFSHGDTTYYEQGQYARPGHFAANSGVPPHNTVFTNINDPDQTFLMPPSYTTNDDLIIVNSTSYGSNLTGTLTLTTPVTCSNIALLAAGGNGGATITYTVNHSSGPADTGTYAVPDWFAGGSQDAWGCNGRINAGGFANFSANSENINPPYMDSLPIKVSSASPVTSVTLAWKSGGGVDNFFALSTSTDGVHYVPAPVTGFNEETIVAASIPFPVTATMDNGTNIAVDPGNTLFEIGYDTNNTGDGLPPSGSILTSINGDGNTYQMAFYTNNNALMIDSTHLSAAMTPVTPAAYSALAFLTVGDSIGSGGVMSNLCVVEHTDGVKETNWVYGYDWTDTGNQGVVAYVTTEAINMGPRVFETSPNPELFESFINVADTTPVTNILISYGYAPSNSSRTCIMAVSGTTTPFGPLIQAGPGPGTQEWYPKQTATISVDVVGSAPITNVWLVESNGNFVPLNNGTDVHGSVVAGATTTTLTISDLTLADATNYEYEAFSANGSETSSNVSITINSGSPVGALISAQYPGASFTVLTNHADVTVFSVTVGSNSAPPISYQWYSVSGGVTNAIPGASGLAAPGSQPTYDNVDNVSRTIFCVVSNFVGAATSTPVTVSIVSSVGVATAYETSVLALKPFAYWPLNEPSGIIAFDRAGTNDGSYVGGVTLNQAGIPAAEALVSNVSVAFDGTTGYVTIPAGKTSLNITGPLTMMQWVLTPIGGETGFTTSFGHSDQSYRISVANGPTVAHFADSGPDVVSAIPLNDGNWHFLVGVYDGVDQHLYVDGIEQEAETNHPSEPSGNSTALIIGGAPDYNNRYFAGNIAQCAIFTNALTSAQVQGLYDDAETAPGDLVISPATPSVYVGRSVILGATTTTGNPTTSYQWFTVVSGATNLITGATSSTYTLTNATLAENGEQIGVTAGNAYGSISTTVPLSVQDVAAALVNDLSPTNSQALTGISATYTVTASGSLPITYQWSVDGKAVSGVTDSSYTFPVQSGLHSLQVSFTNTLNGGTPVVSSVAYLTGLATTPTITFDGGVDWATNSGTASTAVPFFGTNTYFGSNIFEVTDGVTTGEASDGFYDVAQFVGSWTASFVYQVHTFAIPSGDGAVFMLQASPQATNALGADDGALGYAGITQSLALELDMFSAVGIAVETNGITYADGGGPLYRPTGQVTIDSGNPIQFNLTWTNGVLSVNMTDLQTGNTFSTNYTLGPIVDILGSDFAYVGFSGADGDASSVQWFYDFVFNPGGAGVAPPPTGPTLTVSGKTATSFVISWPTSAAGFGLQQASSLSGPWAASSAPITVVGSENEATITIPGTGTGLFYRLKN